MTHVKNVIVAGELLVPLLGKESGRLVVFILSFFPVLVSSLCFSSSCLHFFLCFLLLISSSSYSFPSSLLSLSLSTSASFLCLFFPASLLLLFVSLSASSHTRCSDLLLYISLSSFPFPVYLSHPSSPSLTLTD